MTTHIRKLDRRKLREARLAANITSEQMGQLLGVGKSQVSNIEHGRSTLDGNQLAIWCHACDIRDLDEMYSDILELPSALVGSSK